MKKKTRATASRAGKRPKRAASGQKAAPRRSSAPTSRSPTVSNGTRATIRRLKAELARTQAQIEELQASADTDFMLGIPNRRGFERELNRAMEFAFEAAPVRNAQQEVGIGRGLKFLDLRLGPGQLRLQPANRRLGAAGHGRRPGFRCG